MSDDLDIIERITRKQDEEIIDDSPLQKRSKARKVLDDYWQI